MKRALPLRTLPLMLVAAAMVPAGASSQEPAARLTNLTRPAAADFRIGDRYQIEVTGAPDQPVSVRSTRHGLLDWGPVIGRTNAAGSWRTSGVIGDGDFGGWSEVWTVGGRLLRNSPRHFERNKGVPH